MSIKPITLKVIMQSVIVQSAVAPPMTAKTFDSVWSLAAVTLAGSEDAFFSSSLSSPYKIVKGMSLTRCATFKLHNKLERLSLSNTSTAV